MLTAREREWFRLANLRPVAGWYEFKQRLLRRFATRAGYDFQTIYHACNSCGGMGVWFGDADCRRCRGTGVSHTTEHWLERWDLAGCIYHRPLDRRTEQPETDAAGRLPQPVKVYAGKLHARAALEVSEAEAERCYARLLLRFEPNRFLQYAQNLAQSANAADSRDLNRKLARKCARLWKAYRVAAKADLFGLRG